MGEVSTIGMDLAESVFQVHGADASGAVLLVLSQLFLSYRWAMACAGQRG